MQINITHNQPKNSQNLLKEIKQEAIDLVEKVWEEAKMERKRIAAADTTQICGKFCDYY